MTPSTSPATLLGGSSSSGGSMTGTAPDAVLDDMRDASVARDVGERIAVEHKEVRTLADLDRPELVVPVIGLSDVPRRALERGHGRHAVLDRGSQPEEVRAPEMELDVG